VKVASLVAISAQMEQLAELVNQISANFQPDNAFAQLTILTSGLGIAWFVIKLHILMVILHV
jgi:hypothetical protein